MPSAIDILFERLKQIDEVTLLELLDIDAEALLERFKDRVIKRQHQLYGEIEIYNIDDEELDEEEEWDGYEIDEYDDDWEDQ